MSNSFFMSINRIFIFIFILIISICCLFIPVISVYSLNSPTFNLDILNIQYLWPTPGYTTINSYFGKRISPTAGASSFHKGIDIGAPQGSSLLAVTSGEITFTGFLGGGGYTITLTSGNMKITYCHTSPQFIVKVGDYVQKGDVIGYVGPKNVYGVKR